MKNDRTLLSFQYNQPKQTITSEAFLEYLTDTNVSVNQILLGSFNDKIKYILRYN